jgi:hypothetical protein
MSKVIKTRCIIDEHVFIPVGDIPSVGDLTAAADRLQKDYDILTSYQSEKKREEAERFRSVISLLQMIASKYRQANKQEEEMLCQQQAVQHQ